MFCSNCGKPVGDTPFCANCGAKVIKPEEVFEKVEEAVNEEPAKTDIEPAKEEEPKAELAPEVEVKEEVPEPAPEVEAKEEVPAPAPEVSEPKPEEPAPAAPVEPAAPAAPVEPAAPAEPVQPAAPVMQTPAPQPAPAAAPKKRSKKPLIIILSVVGGLIILGAAAVAGVIGYRQYTITQKYNEAKTAFEAENYEQSLKLFNELGDYEDSEYYAEYSEVEIDSKKIDGLISSKDYDGAIRILKERKDFFGSDSEGRKAAILIDDYTNVKAAYEYMDQGDYDNALIKFNSIQEVYSDYSDDRNYCDAMCRLYTAREENNWAGIIANLYALQIQDFEMKFLADPKTDEDKVIADAYNDGKIDIDKISEIVKPADAEKGEMLEYAIKGFKYEDALKLQENKKYKDAMAAFQELGDFLDSKDRYDSCKAIVDKEEKQAKTYAAAEEYFKNGEYYKAQQAYASIPGYKDSDAKASQCEQELPENGSMKKSNGSGVTMKITAPSGNDVFLKFYDASGNAVAQIFIRAGKTAKLKLKPATYTIKAAYGNTWYGEKDLFGGAASYSQLMNGSSQEFKLKRNYTYTLRLLASTTGNVGSSTVPGGADGM